jgi:hypothetical protein
MTISKLKVLGAALLACVLTLGGIQTLAQQQSRLLVSRPTGHFGQSAKDFAGVRTLKEAVEVLKQELTQNGKAEYAALLSEERVREAMRTAIRSVEASLDNTEQMHKGSKDHFIETAKPVLMKILEEGAWPPNCSFTSFTRLSATVGGKSITYDGFWLRLRVDTPKGKFGGFDLPILDMTYGRAGF